MSEQNRNGLRVFISNALNVRFFGIVALGIVVYFFSIGPAFRLLWTGHISQSTFSSLYAPINSLCKHSDILRRLIDDYYLEMWYSHDRETIRWLDDLKSGQTDQKSENKAIKSQSNAPSIQSNLEQFKK